MKAYLTHNNAYDSIVIMDGNTLVTAVDVTDQTWIGFHSDDPNFPNWSGYFDENCSGPTDYGEIYAVRTDYSNIVITNAELYHDRQDVWEGLGI